MLFLSTARSITERMNFLIRKRLGMVLVVLALAAVLVSLAILQYRWSNEISVATTERMQASLHTSLNSFRQDLSRELSEICSGLEDIDQPTNAEQVSARLENWQRTANHSNLVTDVYFWRVMPSDQLLRLNTRTSRFESVQWPSQYESLRHRLQPIVAGAVTRLKSFGPVTRVQGPGPPQDLGPPRFHVEGPWFFDQDLVALVHPVHDIRGRVSHQGPIPSMGWIVVVLNKALLEQHVLPELAQRYFAASDGLNYKVAVTEESTGRVLYSSDSGFGNGADVDAKLNLFGPPLPAGAPGAENAFFISGPISKRPERALGPPHLHGEKGFMYIEPLGFGVPDGGWQLIVKHRKGSVEAAVASLHRRNLTVSFGTLLVLTLTMALVIITTHRARRLAQLQMEFVAGVSHELRTPLAVISSAAENIADGVVINEEQLARYGGVIRNQAKHLSDLVEQVLLFATTLRTGQHHTLRRLEISALLDAAIESTEAQLKSAGVTVERQIQPGLPLVNGDFAALSQCLQNLITNAIKYGGDSRWIGIRAYVSREREGSTEARITIEDKGIGIDSESLKHIFEPFYRSPSVAGSQIRGTGLGLTLAKSIVETMGGKLTVVSEAGKGTAFTIHLPVTIQTAQAHENGVEIAANSATANPAVANPRFSS